MLTQQKGKEDADDGEGSVGLGIFLEGDGKTMQFTHTGLNAGFASRLVAYAETGQGAVIMINSDNDYIISAILEVIAKEYNWPDYD